MITVKNKIFTITTKNTSYVCQVRDGKYVENLYYGKRLSSELINANEAAALQEKFNNPFGNTIAGAGEERNITLDNLCLELSNPGTGDYRLLPFIIEDENGCISSRFYFADSYLYEGLYEKRDKTLMPYAKWDEKENNTEKPWTLELIFKDSFTDDREGCELRLIYTAFEESDTIVRRTVLNNKSDKPVIIKDISSMMLDLPDTEYTMVTFDGLWTRERHRKDKELVSGIYEISTFSGTSSNKHNPFFMLKENGATEFTGGCYGFNLIYSGNHRERVEVSEYGKTRIVTGINSYAFSHRLLPGESFYTPEATMCFSDMGLSGVSDCCHKFVNEHIVPANFRNMERPILINNWEATYFDFNKRKLTNLAKQASELGMELFVLDDGWFGERNDDTTSLGDWFVNEKKLGGKLSELIDEVKKQGLKFGLWFEPEMISEKSKLYENHPDWAVRAFGRESYLGRNQLILDYSKEEVRDYIVETVGALLRDNDISYVKWDMNRPMTDTGEKQGEFFHSFVLGLYDVMERLTNEFPKVLFEGCSAGGNRFDLGILSYMPQIWTSDDTDPNERIHIQGGTSYGYPQSTMGAHVSAAPNHQTLRATGVETRFNVAAMGVLGYELDLTVLTPNEKNIIKNQTAFYKEHRQLLQFGRFNRVKDAQNTRIWQITSEDKKEAICLLYRELSEPNISRDRLFAVGLDADAMYRVTVRPAKISIKEFGNLINHVSPVKIKEDGIIQAAISSAYSMDNEKEEYLVSGALLMNAGIKLNSRFSGTGMGDGTRVMGDFSSRLYTIKKEDIMS